MTPSFTSNGAIALIAVLAMLTAILAAVAQLMFWRRLNQMQKQLLTRQEEAMACRTYALAEGLYDNVLEADLTHDRLLGNNCTRLTTMLGLPANASYSACIKGIMQKMVKPEYHALYREKFGREEILRRFAAGEEQFTLEFEERSDLAHYRWTRATVCVYYTKQDGAVRITSYVKNIQREKERETALVEAATTNHLTGLLNRRAAELQIDAIFEDSIPACPALLMVDIDHFKQINDALGHAGGDEILCQVAQLIQTHFRASDVVGRFGGDEFMILMKNCASPEIALQKARTLVERVGILADGNQLGTPLSISIGIGIAIFPVHGDTLPILFRNADAALYQVKRHGRGTCRLFDPAEQDGEI